MGFSFCVQWETCTSRKPHARIELSAMMDLMPVMFVKGGERGLVMAVEKT